MAKKNKLVMRELIKGYCEETDYSQAEVKQALDIVADFVNHVVAEADENDSFTLPDLFTIEVLKEGERQRRNPKTGEPITVAEHFKVKVKNSKTLKETLQDK